MAQRLEARATLTALAVSCFGQNPEPAQEFAEQLLEEAFSPDEREAQGEREAEATWKGLQGSLQTMTTTAKAKGEAV